MKNIVIIFGRENAKIIIAFLNDVKKIYLPQIAIITDEKISEEEDFQLYDNRYLALIKKDFKKNLMLYLWEKECYYNERGNIILNLPGKIETNNYINIILTGISRAGKSTLINILSQKLVSLETNVMESVTNYIREYKLITSKNGGFLSGIRFYDTPGLTIIKDKNKKKNTFDEVMSMINKKIKECKDARDDIHLIYFMIRELQNLENYIGFLEKIIELNKKREEEGKKKIYMIFILNKGDDQIEESLKNFLKNHGLRSLLEGDVKTNDKKVNYKEKYLKKEKSLKKEIENNIVQINLIKNKKYGNPIYGFDSLFKKTLFFLKKDNPFYQNPYIFYKLLSEKENLEKNKIDKSIIEKNVNTLYKEIADKNSFFSGIGSIEDILNKIEKENKVTLFFIMLGLFPFLYFIPYDGNSKKNINHFLEEFKYIVNKYKLFSDEIMLKPILDNKNEIFQKFEIVVVENENEKNKINKTIKLIQDSKNIDYSVVDKKKGVYINDKFTKFRSGFFYRSFFEAYLDGYSYEKIVSNWCDDFVKNNCGIYYVLKQKEIFSNILQQMEELSKKKDWDIFHYEIFE